jgi:hypothetical protein
MLPEEKGNDLLYVSDGISGNVHVLSYPQGDEVGELTGLSVPEGTCIDSAQDVFIVIQGSARINVYRHGGTKPIAHLRDIAKERGAPLGCSISPTTGDLAVVNQFGPSYSSSNYAPPNVVIYKAARGKPTVISDPNLSAMYFCGYDGDGNLFVDGTSTYPFRTVLAELPKGSNAFRNVALQEAINDPGGVQWDGADLAVADRSGPSGTAVVYRLAIRHLKARVVATVQLDDDGYIVSFWIQGSRLIGGDLKHGSKKTVRYWKYPAGGRSTKTFLGFTDPAAMTVSLAPDR